MVIIPDVKKLLTDGAREYDATVVGASGVKHIVLEMDALTESERDVIAKGCLINYYKA